MRLPYDLIYVHHDTVLLAGFVCSIVYLLLSTESVLWHILAMFGQLCLDRCSYQVIQTIILYPNFLLILVGPSAIDARVFVDPSEHFLVPDERVLWF